LASANGKEPSPHYSGALAPDIRGLKSPKQEKSLFCRQLKLPATEMKLGLCIVPASKTEAVLLSASGYLPPDRQK